MIGLGNIPAVFLFELRRTITVPRMLWWAVLTVLPPALILLIRMTVPRELPERAWTALLFALVPMLVSMLGTFLWTTTAVSSELEGKSWVYLAVRPHGATAVLLGKFFAAVAWVYAAVFVGLTVGVLLTGLQSQFAVWWPMTLVVSLSVPAYASIYMFIGCAFPKRSMVLAIAYSIPFELLASFIPAVINKFTIQYRLRSLLVTWGEIPLGDSRFFRNLSLSGDEQAWWHVTVLLGTILGLLAASILVIRSREFSASEEPDI